MGYAKSGIIVEDIEGNAYRAVYTVKLAEVVYVLHAFQKKSKTGIKTSQADMDKVRARLKLAAEIHARYENKARKKEA